jgi:acyl-CoA-binding protein
MTSLVYSSIGTLHDAILVKHSKQKTQSVISLYIDGQTATSQSWRPTTWPTRLVSIFNTIISMPLLTLHSSTDRVFGHALNTVNKIRTGSQKPPVSERLRLYGLYKQAMEGDVEYVQSRPTHADKKEIDKWDAWASNSGLSRTQAKRQYIETLLHTMHEYASATPEARELVTELDFVWDQVRNNSNPSASSDASSPLRVLHEQPSNYPGMLASSVPLQILSPVSQGDEDELDEERDDQDFVDAPISQFDDTEHPAMDARENQDDNDHHHQQASPSRQSRPTTSSPLDIRWRKRVESALVKMTTEVAALREQLESRSFIAQRRKHSLLGWMLRASWFLVKLVAADMFILWIVILYLRRKKDTRLEGAVRVLLGDAVAQMQKVSSKVKVPKLTAKT